MKAFNTPCFLVVFIQCFFCSSDIISQTGQAKYATEATYSWSVENNDWDTSYLSIGDHENTDYSLYDYYLKQTNGSLAPSTRQYYYRSNTQVDSIITYEFDGQDKGTPIGKTIYLYEGDYRVYTGSFGYDAGSSSWIKNNEEKHILNQNGTVNHVLFYQNIGVNNLIPIDSEAVHYSSMGLNDTTMIHSWNNGVWTLNRMRAFTYDQNDREISFTYLTTSNNQHTPINRFLTSYNSQGLEDSLVYQTWVNGEFETQYIDTRTYTSFGDRASVHRYTPSGENFILETVDLYIYNDDSKPIDFLRYNVTGNDSIGIYRVSKTYKADTVSGFDLAQLENIRVYPNPTSSNVKIDLPSNWESVSIELIDLNGIRIAAHKTTDSGSIEISLEALPRGHYFILIKSTNALLAVHPIILK